MEFLIADTFTDSLAKLTGEEKKSVKTTAFDLQLNPANPGMSFHKPKGTHLEQAQLLTLFSGFTTSRPTNILNTRSFLTSL